MTLPAADIQKILAELDELHKQLFAIGGEDRPTFFGISHLTPAGIAELESFRAECDVVEDKIDLKFKELRALLADWSQITWEECQEKHPKLHKDLLWWIDFLHVDTRTGKER
jgi:hypothetical protein